MRIDENFGGVLLARPTDKHAVTDGIGEAILYVLEQKNGTTMVLLPDGVWYDSTGDAGVLKLTSSRVVVDYTGETLLEMTDTVEGENVTIVFGGENTRLNDDENYTGMTGLVVGEIYKRNGAWKFNAIGQPVQEASRLDALIRLYA